MKPFTLKRINQACAAALALGFSGTLLAADAPGGQLLFVSGVVKIMDAKGVERPAKKGDSIGPGEHLVTGSGSIGQIKLPDGSLIGLRPDSDLKLDNLKPGVSGELAERVLFLSKGAVRVVNVDSDDRIKHLPVLLQTPTATIGLRNADNESIIIPTAVAGGLKPTNDPGTYSRMAVGGGIMKTLGGETSLGASQTAFAGIGATALPPTKIAAIPELVSRNILPVEPGVSRTIPGGSPALPDKVDVPVAGLITVRPLPPLGTPELPGRVVNPDIVISKPDLISPLKPIAIAPVLPTIPLPITLPVKPPTLVNTGSIDVSNLSIAKIETLSPTILKELPQTTLEKLSPTVLSTLPPETIKSLDSVVQTSVTTAITTSTTLTPIQKTTLTTAITSPTTVTAPITTKTIVPITTTTTLKTTTFTLRK